MKRSKLFLVNWGIGICNGFVFLAVLCATLTVFVPHSAFAASYYTAGDVSAAVYWDVPHGMVAEEDEVRPEWEQTSMMLSVDLTGPGGNTAGAIAVASLPLGILSSYGSGITPENEGGSIPGIAIGRATSRLRDVLTFTVPAGTYEDDVIAVLRGSVSGFFSVTGDGSPSGSGYARFTAGFGAGNSVKWRWYDEDGAISQEFALSHRLVSAGTLSDPREISIPIHALLHASGQSRGGGHVSSGLADFSNSAHFLSVDVPEGVTWTSDSGVFLIPIPGSIFLFASGLGALSFLKKRRINQ